MQFNLPWPSAALSGHAGGHWRSKATPTAKHREWARLATLGAKATAPATGDIPIHVYFVPPDRRGDRTNFANRLKPYFDGIAEALGVNDARFLPSYAFGGPEKPGHVLVTIGGGALMRIGRPPNCNIRKMRDVVPGELARYVSLVKAVAKLQDRKPPPEPTRARCA